MKGVSEKMAVTEVVARCMERCNKCGIKIQESITGREKFDGKTHCKNCYYELAGEIFENHPIGVPRKPLRA